MSKLLTREQYIKKARRIRHFYDLMYKFKKLFRKPGNKFKSKEIFINTNYGKVRTLWYGFENTEKASVLFDLHGGGFILGRAEMDENINIGFAGEIGCKIISIDYAKAPEYPYPAAVNQTYAVVKHVYENADKYMIDTGRMAIGGHSAGANIGTVTCLKAKKEGLFQFVCQILDYPPLDLATSPLDKPRPKGSIPPNMALVFDASYVDPDQARDPFVSPVYAAPEDLAGLPPALFILAGRDSLHDEGLKYCGLLNAAGVVTECHEYPDAAHGFTYEPSKDTVDALEKMTAFLKRYIQAG